MNWSSRRAGVVATAAAVLAVSVGCGVHPGAAADVDGTRIALDDVDRYTEAFCDATSAFAESQPGAAGAQPVERQELRQQVAGVLIRLELAREVAEDLDVEVAPSELAVDEAALPPAIQELEDDQRETLVELFGQSQELSVLYGAIGEEVDPDGANPDPVAAGQEYVAEQTSDADISVDPRIGLDDDLEVSDGSGLSVSGGEQELSPAQTCG